MNLSSPSLLVVAVFVSQILVLSVLVPYRFHRAYSRLKEKYPPQDYPKLYPVGPAEVARFNAILAVVRLVIVLVGIARFAVQWAEGDDPADLAQTMMWVAIAQAVPALLRLRWELRVARAFRAMPAPAVRSAELRASRLGDFVPLPLVLAGVGGLVLSLGSAVFLYVTDPDQPRIVAVAIFVLAYSGWLLARIVIALNAPGSSPRPDPYMTDADVFRARRLRLRVLFTVAAAVGIGLTLIVLFQAGMLPVDIVAIRIGASILYQLVYLGTTQAVMKTLAMRDTNVYRVEAT